MHKKNISTAGTPLKDAKKALVMLHGRGANAADILGLAGHLHTEGFALLAPQASNHTWYPYSFLAPPAQNEPWLSSAITVIEELVADIEKAGIPKEQIWFAGFSQGACLTLEYTARHAARYGGIAAFTGGLIGDRLYPENYTGNFNDTPIFIGSSDPDPHVPVERVKASAALLTQLGAEVTEKIYPGMGHTITQDEIRLANQLIFQKSLA